CRTRANQRNKKFTEEFLMKRLFLMAGLMAAFMLLVVAASAQKASFAGTWSLDKSKSQGLSQRIQGADKVTWTVTQDDKIIAIDQKVEGGQPPRVAAQVVAAAQAVVAAWAAAVVAVPAVRQARSLTIWTAKRSRPKD